MNKFSKLANIKKSVQSMSVTEMNQLKGGSTNGGQFVWPIQV